MKPTQVLMEDHRVIEHVLSAMQLAAERLSRDELIRPAFCINAALFITNFADGIHHRKEEGVLFPAMIDSGIPARGGPVAVMLAEHEQRFVIDNVDWAFYETLLDRARREAVLRMKEVAGDAVVIVNVYRKFDFEMPAKILLVDDEREVREDLNNLIEDGLHRLLLVVGGQQDRQLTRDAGRRAAGSKDLGLPTIHGRTPAGSSGG